MVMLSLGASDDLALEQVKSKAHYDYLKYLHFDFQEMFTSSPKTSIRNVFLSLKR